MTPSRIRVGAYSRWPARACRARLQRLDDPQPEAAAGDDDPQGGVASPACASSASTSPRTASRSTGRRRLSADGAIRVEVVVERERAPAVEAHHLEDAVAAQQPLVRRRDPRLRGVVTVPSRMASMGRTLAGSAVRGPFSAPGLFRPPLGGPRRRQETRAGSPSALRRRSDP